MIPYGRQSISQADIEAVAEVLRSDFLTQGPLVPRFEETVAQYCNAAYGVAVNSATSALHIACLALGAGPNDLIWTSPVTFVASANCALYCGADVDFVNIDPDSFTMSVSALEEKLERAGPLGKLPKIVIPVHMCGQSCDMAAIHKLSLKYGFRIIEDGSHAIGARYQNQPVGNCAYSDVCVFSFHPVKIVTTGEGGMAVTNDEDVARKMTRLRSHGITRDRTQMQAQNPPPWFYEQQDLGFNYRLTDIQAALGVSQMAKLDEFVAKRQELARAYAQRLEHLPICLPMPHPDSFSSWHLYVIRLQGSGADRAHREVFTSLQRAGIGVNLHYMPVYLQPFYANLGFEPGLCPEAERYAARAISLPMFPDLSSTDQETVASALERALKLDPQTLQAAT